MKWKENKVKPRRAYILLETVKTAKGEYIPCIVEEGSKGYWKTDWAWGIDETIA